MECIRRLWEADECIVLRCGECGFGFGVPFVGGDEQFYALIHEQKDYPSWRWDYDIAFSEAVRKFSGGRILDVGAGVGKFLRRLDSNWVCYACEASESTRRELEGAGVRVFRNLSDAAQAAARTFQIVTLFQVLEHIADFNILLEHCHRLLVNGGLIVITVPDCDAMIRQEQVTGCHDMPPNHINKWTPSTLTTVLDRAGFQAGQPIFEPASWRNLKASVHMRVMADALSKSSLTAQVYRIKSRTLRIGALACLGVPALVRMLPNTFELRRGGAFAMIGVSR
jgi:2-polyprenyl-3-methyl-5-hydroxy-6-metoxy-1,4-benzoquinol methylase